MAKSDKRVKVTLECTDCKRRNYITMKSKMNDRERLEMQKYCSTSASTPAQGDSLTTSGMTRNPGQPPRRWYPGTSTEGQ